LVGQCLAKDPDERFQSAHDVGLELKWVGAAVSEDRTAGEESAGHRPPLQRALPWALAGALVGALIAGLLVWKFAAPATPSAMHFSAVTNFAGVQGQPAISPDGRSVAFVSNRDGHFNIYVGLVQGGSLVQITHDSNLESAPSWSPDGATLAYARLGDGGMWDVWEVSALGGTPRRVILDAADPAWSPDGHSLAYLNLAADGYGGIWVSGISGENARQAVPPWSKGLQDAQPRFSPDGRQIAFGARLGGPYGELAVADLDSGKWRLLTHDNALALSPAWSGDGRSIYFASSRAGTINIWKIAATGGEPEQITAGEGDDVDLDISKGGKEIVFGTLRKRVGIAQLDLQANPGQPSVKVLTTEPAGNEFGPVYSPDGKHLAYFTNHKGIRHEEIWVSDAAGTNGAPLVEDSRVNIFPAWTPDSKHLVYQTAGPVSKPELRRVSLSGGAPQFLAHGGGPPDVGRDGRVLFWSEREKVEAFDPRTGKTQALGTLPAGAGLARWLPDEHSVAYIVLPSRADDPSAGLWVTDFRNPPHQIFRGPVVWFSRGPGNEIYFLEGKPDLTAVLWKVNWNGQGLTRTRWTVPLLYNINYFHTGIGVMFGVSPDGRYLAFQTDQVLQENIGMIENVR
jgi:Tol biopolymer transport system component